MAGAWSTPIRVTGEYGEPGPHTDFKYAKNNSTTTAPALVKTDRTPAGWSDTPPSLSSGEYLWMTQAEIDANNSLLHPTVGWATPVRISGEQGPKGDDGAPGEHGTDGKDGKDYEWIFARTSEYKAPAQPPTAQQDDYIPSSSETSDGQVWTDDAVGPDSDTPYEWASKRVKVNGMWGKFTDPALWAKFSFDGADGVDGEGVEYIFTRTETEDPGTVPDVPDVAEYDNPPAPWTDDPTGVDATYRYEWVSKRNKEEGVWGAF